MKQVDSGKAIRMQYLSCDKEGPHYGQRLSLICIQKQCKNQGLICSICREEDHVNHRVVPAKMFLQSLVKQRQEMQGTALDRTLNSLIEARWQIVSGLRDIVEKLAETIRIVQQSILKYYANLQNEILEKVQACKDFDQIINSLLNGQYDSKATAQENLLRIISITKVQKQKFMINLEFEEAIRETAMANAKFTNEFAKIKEFSDNFQNLSKGLFQTVASRRRLGFSFSPRYKSSEIEVDATGKFAKKTIKNTPRYVVCDPALLPGMNKAKFKVKNLVSWVGFGICLLNKVEQKSFSFEEGSSIGHGSYLVTNNSMIWSNTQSTENNQKKGFAFQKDDIVEVEYQISTNKVTFKRVSDKPTVGPNTIELKVNIPTGQQSNVFFCATLCSINDQVQIL